MYGVNTTGPCYLVQFLRSKRFYLRGEKHFNEFFFQTFASNVPNNYYMHIQYLVAEREIGEGREALGPLDGHEEQARGTLVDGLVSERVDGQSVRIDDHRLASSSRSCSSCRRRGNDGAAVHLLMWVVMMGLMMLVVVVTRLVMASLIQHFHLVLYSRSRRRM